MDDRTIVQFYWDRSESAIDETDKKYGPYCHSFAQNMLTDREDARECVSDTYLAAWNAMPPKRPAILSTFLGKITRRLSIDRWRSRLPHNPSGSACAAPPPFTQGRQAAPAPVLMPPPSAAA